MNNIRMCLACKARKNKSELFRLIYDEDLGFVLDEKQKQNKRALYICKDNKCLNKILLHKNMINFLKPVTREIEIKLVSDSFKDAVKKLGGI